MVSLLIVMVGLDPTIHVVRSGDFMAKQRSGGGAWMPGSSPGMTEFYDNILISKGEKDKSIPSPLRGNDGRSVEIAHYQRLIPTSCSAAIIAAMALAPIGTR